MEWNNKRIPCFYRVDKKKNTWLWARDFYRATVDESGLEPESVLSHKSRTNNLIVLVEFLFDFFQLTISNWFYTFFFNFTLSSRKLAQRKLSFAIFCCTVSTVHQYFIQHFLSFEESLVMEALWKTRFLT